jgi:hypothetical protein
MRPRGKKTGPAMLEMPWFAVVLDLTNHDSTVARGPIALQRRDGAGGEWLSRAAVLVASPCGLSPRKRIARVV